MGCVPRRRRSLVSPETARAVGNRADARCRLRLREGCPRRRRKTCSCGGHFRSGERTRARLRTSNVIPGGCSNVVAKTDLVRKVGGFDERLTYTEDWDLWIRLVAAGRPAACQEVLVAHVEHLDNALFRYRPDVASEVEYVLTKHDPDADGTQVCVFRLQTLEWMAYEFRRAGYRREAARIYFQIARERRGVGDLARALVMLSGTRGEASARMLRRAFSRSTVGGNPLRRPPRPGSNGIRMQALASKTHDSPSPCRRHSTLRDHLGSARAFPDGERHVPGGARQSFPVPLCIPGEVPNATGGVPSGVAG